MCLRHSMLRRKQRSHWHHKNHKLITSCRCRYFSWTRLNYCNGNYRSRRVRMCTRYACFRQETVEAVRWEQLRITGFQCKRWIFGLSEGLFVSQRGLYYGICWLEKIGSLKHVTRFKKIYINFTKKNWILAFILSPMGYYVELCFK